MKLLFISLLFITYQFIFGQTKNENGFIKFYYPNGQISSEGLMTNGKPDGEWKTYYVTGLLKSIGKRTNHLLDSIWVFFNETADTTEKITYFLDKKNGYSYKFGSYTEKNSTKSNIIIAKELFINDSREGLSYYYYPNGKLKEIINYKNNKKFGIAREFDQDSTLITLYEYLNDYLVERQLLNRKNDNKFVGIWRNYYDNGTLKSEKNYKNGELHGYAKEYDSEGNLTNYQLFREGKIQKLEKSDTLDIEERITYFPDKKIKTRFYFKKNVPVGIHREYDFNGNVIKTWIYDNIGKLTGTGIVNDDGSRNGKFTYFHDDGSVKSDGEYKNNRQHGKWFFYFKRGYFEQVGNFNNGYFDGEWRWYYPDSNLLRSEYFVNGKRNGLFYELSELGDTIERGNFLDNLKNGAWFIKSGDIIERGNYTNDLKDGVWKAWYSNNVLMYEGNFINGNPDGKHLFYFENEFLKEEQFYVNGFKEKVWKKYNEDGTLFITITYMNDIETRVNGVKLPILKKN